jgi:hypothetical protein
VREREAELLEGRVRRTLGTLDTIDVPGLDALATRRAPVRGRRAMRNVRAFGATAAVLVLALIVGAQLNTWRAALSRPNDNPAAPGVAGQIAADDRYGLLVRLPGDAITLVDEIGRQLMPAFTGLVEARTSPNGRYIALWLSTGSGFELRILDGVSRALGPTLFATAERYARSNEGLVWASDSSAVLVTTTGDPVANSVGEGDIRVNLRTIDRTGGNVRVIATYTAFVLQPLGWDRGKNTILARVSAKSGQSKYLRFIDGGTPSVVERSVTDMPLIANDDATFIAALASCPPPGPCRTFTIHDAETYAVVAQIDLERFAPLTRPNANWAILFRPRSSDVIVYFSRTTNAPRGVFGIEMYANAGRGARRDLGDLTVAARADGTIVAPNAFIRADGSATFYVSTGLTSTEWRGDLIDLVGRARTTVETPGAPIATVLLDSRL